MDTATQLKILLEEEPSLEIDFPRVFVQPKIDSFCLGKANVLKLLNIIKKSLREEDGDAFTRAYNELLVGFRPAINWAKSSWDYLLTKENIRYVSRPEGEKMYCHGDYRAFTDKDFHKLIHKIFKECVLKYIESKTKPYSFTFYIKKNFWDEIVEEYKILENPPDPLQRKLTLYSYLRCVPYEFFNSYHQETVDNTLGMLKKEEHEIIDLHFINFLKEEEILRRKNITADIFCRLKENILNKITLLNPLVCALLLQIERY